MAHDGDVAGGGQGQVCRRDVRGWRGGCQSGAGRWSTDGGEDALGDLGASAAAVVEIVGAADGFELVAQEEGVCWSAGRAGLGEGFDLIGGGAGEGDVEGRRHVEEAGLGEGREDRAERGCGHGEEARVAGVERVGRGITMGGVGRGGFVAPHRLRRICGCNDDALKSAAFLNMSIG